MYGYERLVYRPTHFYRYAYVHTTTYELIPNL